MRGTRLLASENSLFSNSHSQLTTFRTPHHYYSFPFAICPLSLAFCPCHALDMAPIHTISSRVLHVAKRAIITAGPDVARLSTHTLLRRSLSVNSTQKVTLGIIAVYIVVIALLWNLPYSKQHQLLLHTQAIGL